MPHLLPLSLKRRRPGRIRPRLAPLADALQALGDPQLVTPSILITGSNGKGSTAAMLEGMLAAHGVATGLYTSPHLVRVEERIRILGQAIARDALDRHLATLDSFPHLTFFETLTAGAFLAFAEAGLDCVVLEVGMGGRWDATRLARSQVAGLTNVGTDHAAWLGADRHAIASDKGAALAAADLAVLGPEVDPPMVAHLGVSGALHAEELVRLEELAEGRVCSSWNGIDAELTPPLVGRHQRHNLHLAMALARAAERAGLVPPLDPAAVRRGLGRVHWPGRLSRHRVRGREILIDGAHNLEATRALVAHLERQPQRFNLVFSCLDDKPIETMAMILRPAVDRVAVCPLADERAMPTEQLHRSFPDAEVSDTPLGALERLPDPVLAAGSLRLAGVLLDHEEGA